MKITTALGDSYEAKEVCVRMVKTIGVEVYLADLGQFVGGEVSEEELEEIAQEDWLEAYAQILEMVSKGFPYIDIEGISTDNVRIEVIE